MNLSLFYSPYAPPLLPPLLPTSISIGSMGLGTAPNTMHDPICNEPRPPFRTLCLPVFLTRRPTSIPNFPPHRLSDIP